MQTTTAPTTRLVLFLTQMPAPDIPGDAQRPQCLLPLGTASFLERVMDSCALAGLRSVDLVVSAQPELLRQTLHDGTPWGLALRWHHAKEAATPYRLLHTLQLEPDELLILGHAHHWVSSRLLGRLAGGAHMVMRLDPHPRWLGWASLPAAALQSLSPHADSEALARLVAHQAGMRCAVAAANECAEATDAAALLAAQAHALDGIQEAAVPASWVRTPWGAASPDAVVAKGAELHGPVLIGPRCVVEAGAIVGPHTVLAPDVFVARGAHVRQALLLSDTYVGSDVSLEHAVAQGHAVHSLKWSVSTRMRPEDAWVAPLHTPEGDRPGWTSRLGALLLLLGLLPVALALAAWQRAVHGQPAWRIQRAVRGTDPSDGSLRCIPVRQAAGSGLRQRLLGVYGGLLDIVQGRRTWVGIRPRREADWFALGHDWQTLFGNASIGLFHAPAWSEGDGRLDQEAHAAADAYLAVQRGPLARWRMVAERRLLL